MTSSSRPPRARPRSTRHALESLEDRRLLAADAAINVALDKGIVALLEAVQVDKGAVYNSIYDVQKFDVPFPGDGWTLQERGNAAAAAAAGPLWDAAWSDVLTVKGLMTQAVAIAESVRSYPHNSPQDQQANAQIQALHEQAAPILDGAAQKALQITTLIAQAREDTTWYPGKPAEPAPAPNVPGSGTPNDPFRVGLDQTVKVGDTLTLPGGVQVQVDAGGAPPVEAGVDWNGWYRNQLIPTVRSKVFGPMMAAFPNVRDQLEVTLTYEIFKDGRTVAVITHVEGSPAQGQPQNVFRKNVSTWANNAKNLMPGLGVPLPANTQMPSLIRTFTFSLNSGGPAMHLAGPPKEGAGPGFHLDPRSGLRVQQIRTVRPRGPQLALSKGVRWSRSSTA
jgi:hypothetical protein